MPVGLQPPSELLPVRGVRLGTAAAGIRRPGRDDLTIIACGERAQAAATFTRNRFCAAPVVLARRHLATGAPRALVINSGCANAGTGEAGERDALAVCREVAAALSTTPERVLPFSTGVIGERLPVTRIAAAVPACVAGLRADGWLHAARAIMTTDTVPKGASRRIDLGGVEATVTGIAKGAGMIRPDMATMLAFLATDAPVAASLLQSCLDDAVEHSFNRITVDGDTSTNDACVLLANGEADMPELRDAGSPGYAELRRAVQAVTLELAHAVVRDAEGATKFIAVEVRGGASEADCLAVAFTVAHSPLVKTAFFASDPNWGRILAAVGRAPVAALDIGRVGIRLNGRPVLTAGAVDPGYTEALGQAVMREAEVRVTIELGAGEASATVWTSDLSHEYVRINAEYRT